MVLMPNSNGCEMDIAERIRRTVEETEFPGFGNAPLKITISAGVWAKKQRNK